MSGEGEGKSNRLVIVLGITVLLLLLAVVVLATPLRDLIFAPRTAPTIELEILEGELDGETGLYGYLVQAVVTGRPAPEVQFNRNDGVGKVKRNHALILLGEGESFLLQATASNVLGSVNASLELNGGMDTAKGDPDTAALGTIEGYIVYPSSGVHPELQVVAENVLSGQEYFAGGIITDSKYLSGFGFMIQVPSGDYHVYASLPGDDYRAYYDVFVQSNHTIESYEKIVVTITPGLHVDDVVVGNWYIVPPGTPSNRNPVITGITFPDGPLFCGETYSITANASDPDGDPLSYSWQVTGGGWLVAESTGNPLSFIAPSNPGEYLFRVTVSDGRGGEAERSQTVRINPVVEIGALQFRTGYIEKNETAQTTGIVHVGDSNLNNICRGYITFDTGQLAGARVHKVELRLANPQVFGDPRFMHTTPREKTKGLWIEVVVWGNRSLQQSDYDLPANPLSSSLDYDITRVSTVGGNFPALAEALQTYIDAGYTNFQLRLRFEREVSNNNNAWDAVVYLWQNITMKVWYEQR